MGMAFNGYGRQAAYNPGLGQIAPQQQAFPVPQMAQAAPGDDPRRKLFGKGDIGGIASGIGKLLMYGPFAGVAQGNINQGLDTTAVNNDFRERQLALQAQIANTRADTEPALIKSLRGLGVDPTSPEGRAAGLSNLSRPIVMGNAEGGFTAVGGAFGMPGTQPQPSGPPPEAIARLRSNPSEAAQFDEIFGPGASARALGGM